MADPKSPTPAPAPKETLATMSTRSGPRKARTKRTLTSFEQSLKDEQTVARSIARKLAGLSEEARARVVQMLNQYTQKA